MQRYRSGHNGADSKSVCRQRHVGSNPTRCAIQTPLPEIKQMADVCLILGRGYFMPKTLFMLAVLGFFCISYHCAFNYLYR